MIISTVSFLREWPVIGGGASLLQLSDDLNVMSGGVNANSSGGLGMVFDWAVKWDMTLNNDKSLKI